MCFGGPVSYYPMQYLSHRLHKPTADTYSPHHSSTILEKSWFKNVSSSRTPTGSFNCISHPHTTHQYCNPICSVIAIITINLGSINLLCVSLDPNANYSSRWSTGVSRALSSYIGAGCVVAAITHGLCEWIMQIASWFRLTTQCNRNLSNKRDVQGIRAKSAMLGGAASFYFVNTLVGANSCRRRSAAVVVSASIAWPL